jgi:molybdopterin-guanine dinucleotide biosynthesis protein MobB
MEPTILCIVGRAGAGKTSFIERLIPYLNTAGLKVATLKYSRRPLGLTYPATDSARLARAGATRSILLSKEGMVVFPTHQSSDLGHALSVAGQGCDLVLAEAGILEGAPVIEVVRAGLPVFPDDVIWLSVSHKPTGRNLEVSDESAAAQEILKMLAVERSLSLAK